MVKLTPSNRVPRESSCWYTAPESCPTVIGQLLPYGFEQKAAQSSIRARRFSRRLPRL